jgi:uncharacterized protein (TIGR02996 family)
MARKRSTTHEEAFLQSICESRGDDGPRLVYADWLEDNGQPQRAEFIRLQCRLAATGEDAPERLALQDREWEMLTVYGDAWRQSLPAWARRERHEFRRGFVDRMSLTATEFIRKGEALLRTVPLYGVRLRAVAHYMPDVAACPHLAKLAGLDLRENDLIGQDVRALTAAPHLHNLTDLSLSRNRIGLDGLKALASWRQFPFLKALDLSSGGTGGTNVPDAEAVRALLPSRRPGRLACLDLSDNFRVGDQGASTLVSSPRLGRLTHLWLKNCGVGGDGIRALGASAHLENLTALDLSGPHADAEFIPALAAAPLVGRLTTLLLNEAFGSEQTSALAETPHLGRLRRLELRKNGLGQGGVEAVARARLTSLTALLLAENKLTDPDALEALGASPNLAALVSLDLSHNRFGDAGVKSLIASPHLGNLRELHMENCQVGSEGAAALAASPSLAGLTALHLGGNSLGDEGARALASSPYLSNLRVLDLERNSLTDAGALALAKSPPPGPAPQALSGRPRPQSQGAGRRCGIAPPAAAGCLLV